MSNPSNPSNLPTSTELTALLGRVAHELTVRCRQRVRLTIFIHPEYKDEDGVTIKYHLDDTDYPHKTEMKGGDLWQMADEFARRSGFDRAQAAIASNKLLPPPQEPESEPEGQGLNDANDFETPQALDGEIV